MHCCHLGARRGSFQSSCSIPSSPVSITMIYSPIPHQPHMFLEYSPRHWPEQRRASHYRHQRSSAQPLRRPIPQSHPAARPWCPHRRCATWPLQRCHLLTAAAATTTTIPAMKQSPKCLSLLVLFTHTLSCLRETVSPLFSPQYAVIWRCRPVVPRTPREPKRNLSASASQSERNTKRDVSAVRERAEKAVAVAVRRR